MRIGNIVTFFCLLILTACTGVHKKTLFTLVDNSNINFENKLTETKEFNVFKYRNFYNGGGVATGDLNNDGLPDVFFTANQGSNKLYLNKGNFQFEDISERAGFKNKEQWSTGVVFVDINDDGWLDIYVCNAGSMLNPELRKNQLFINNHDLTFTESAAKYGLDNDGYSTQASFFDYDLDGDLDCFIVNNSPIPVNTLNYANLRSKPEDSLGLKDMLKGGGNHLYRNDNGKFTEVTKEAGMHIGLISLGLGVNVGDINNDGYPDIYVSNDFFERDYLYVNQKDGTFSDELEKYMQHTSLSSMGADIQDVNNDGYPDIFTTDMLPSDDYRLKANTSFDNYDIYKIKQNLGFFHQFTQNALQIGSASGYFQEAAYFSGVAASDWSWGALMFDADNDGLNDIYVSNGIYRDVTDQDFIDFFGNDIVKQMVITGKKEDVKSVIDKIPSRPIPNNVFKNMGGLQFKEVGKEWGMSIPSFSNGAAYADLDNDGDLDLIVNNVNEKAMVFRNNSRELNDNNYLSVSLKYKSPNEFAIGSMIHIFSGGQIISREVMPSRGFQSSVDYKQVFGLGKMQVDSLKVFWPNGTETLLLKPAVNRSISISYNADSTTKPQPVIWQSPVIFEKLSTPFDKHNEDDYVDFYAERNIPFMLSKQGPKCATGDVNGDGLIDIYIGGAKGQAGQLYIQTAGRFVKKEVPDFKSFSFDDVTAAFFFDCDGDGDLDLFVGGGGNFASAGSVNFQNLLYLNDGKGNFSLKRGALPVSNTNCGTAIPLDYDGDGDMDIFIGSRSVPQSYGDNPESFLLQNDGKGNFKNVTGDIAPAIKNAGMVTAACFADINGDNKNELIITGDWMYPQVFSFNGKKFEELKATGLENLYGWWQSIAVADMDGDGSKDIVLGNFGQNFYLSPDSVNPVKIWIKDFDNNGTSDKIFSRTFNSKDVPVFMKREITDQIPSLKKQNLRHQEYASKTIQELFGDQLQNAVIKKVDYTASCIAYNDGKGHFTIKNLPIAVQLSSLNAIAIVDINNDGKPDIITGGNFFDLQPQFGRLDANYGIVLMNNGNRNFSALPPSNALPYLTGQTRDIISLKYNSRNCFLFLQNNDFPVMYAIKPETKTAVK